MCINGVLQLNRGQLLWRYKIIPQRACHALQLFARMFNLDSHGPGTRYAAKCLRVRLHSSAL